MPDISVIVPAYNEEKYIFDCLSSVFVWKTDRSFEVIVVDNNSEDTTAEIASKFNVKLVLEKKPGASAARNTGASLAKSEILYFLDADCRLLPGVLGKILEAFDTHPDVTIVAGPPIYDRDGFLPYLITDKLQYFYFYMRIFKVITKVDLFPGGGFAIKKDVFEKVGGFDETIDSQEIVLPDDLDLAIRLKKAGLNKLLFDKKYKFYSSFRRVKRAPIRHSFVRFLSTVQMLLRG
jgi:glycosyltransferase involved in cell wall biosynthesis